MLLRGFLQSTWSRMLALAAWLAGYPFHKRWNWKFTLQMNRKKRGQGAFNAWEYGRTCLCRARQPGGKLAKSILWLLCRRRDRCTALPRMVTLASRKDVTWEMCCRLRANQALGVMERGAASSSFSFLCRGSFGTQPIPSSPESPGQSFLHPGLRPAFFLTRRRWGLPGRRAAFCLPLAVPACLLEELLDCGIAYA